MLQDYFWRMFDRVLAQEVKGTYVDRSYKTHSYCLFLLSLVNIVFGILFTVLFSRLYEIKIPYSSSGNYQVFLPYGTVNFYIQLNDFYQSHLRNSRSISYKQLEGKKDVESSRTSPLDYQEDTPIYPAGILPNTFFTDKFAIEGLEIETGDISWGNVKKDVKESGYTRDEVVPPPLWDNYLDIPDLHKDNRFLNWIYTAPYYSFRKLWGKLDVPREGVYSLQIDSSYEYGEKSVFLSQTSWAGNKNYFLSVGMIVAGVVGLLTSYWMYKYFRK